MGLYNFSHSFGPAIAPALGGHLIEMLNWRAIFYINVPVGLISAGDYPVHHAEDTRTGRPAPSMPWASAPMTSFLVAALARDQRRPALWLGFADHRDAARASPESRW